MTDFKNPNNIRIAQIAIELIESGLPISSPSTSSNLPSEQGSLRRICGEFAGAQFAFVEGTYDWAHKQPPKKASFRLRVNGATTEQVWPIPEKLWQQALNLLHDRQCPVNKWAKLAEQHIQNASAQPGSPES